MTAALKFFAEHGFAGTSIRQTTQAVRMAENALHCQFERDKAEVFAAVIADVTAARTESFMLDQGQEDVNSIRGEVDRHVEFFLRAVRR